jgi:hypothetical protein
MQTATETITGQERISYSSKWTLFVMSFFPVECGTMLGNLVSKSNLRNDNNRSAMILELLNVELCSAIWLAKVIFTMTTTDPP